jgi:hypothetical protein
MEKENLHLRDIYSTGIVKSPLSLEIQTVIDAVFDELPAGTAEIDPLAAMLNHLKTHYSSVQYNDVNRIKNKLAVVNDFCGIEMFLPTTILR